MSGRRPFWGTVLIVVGVLLLLDNLNLLGGRFWQIIWPVLLIALGVWALLRPRREYRSVVGSGHAEPQRVAVPLGGAMRARVRLQHGAGRLNLRAGANPEELLSGSAAGGIDLSFRPEGDTLTAELRGGVDAGSSPGPWARGGHDWSLALNTVVPLLLEIETSAGESYLDLSELLVGDLRLQAGSGSSELTLPAHAGRTNAAVKSSAAAVNIRVPEGVAANIRLKTGLAGVDVDTTRFPRVGDVYQSVDYGLAADSVDLEVESGVGAVTIR